MGDTVSDALTGCPVLLALRELDPCSFLIGCAPISLRMLGATGTKSSIQGRQLAHARVNARFLTESFSEASE